MQSFWKRLAPFIFLGIMLVLAVVGVILFSYLLIFGAIVGVILFIIAWIKELFFRKKIKILQHEKHKTGRTIDHDDL